MKRLLLFSVLCLFFINLSAQTKTWIGPSEGFFSEPTFWSPSGVPGSSNDVIIPTGSNIILNGANIKSIVLQGNAIAIMAHDLIFSSSSSIAANATLNCTSGVLQGSGTLTNNGNFNVNGGISIRDTVTIINNGAFTVNSTGFLYLGYGSPILNNTASGVINLNAESGTLYGQVGELTIINSGLIKRAQGTGDYRIEIPLKNNNGTISVENGDLSISNPATVLTDGIYNVAEESILNLNHTFTCVGTLTGQLDGSINWAGTLNIDPGTETFLNFNDPEGFNWMSGQFSGDGTLTNIGIMNWESSSSKSIRGISTLTNEGVINENATGLLLFGYGSPTLNNTTSGVINLNAESGSFYGQSGVLTVINTGLIKRAQGAGDYKIEIPLQNNNGIISVEKGVLTLSHPATVLTDGIYNVSSDGILNLNHTFTCVGTLTGQLDGSINWAGTLNVDPGTEAILNFNEPEGFNWISGQFSGDGTLTNIGTMNWESSSSKSIRGISTLKNEGVINENATGSLYFGYGSPTLNNMASGVINILTDGSISGQNGYVTIINTGIIKKDLSTGNFIIDGFITNSAPGKIISEMGLLQFGYGTFQGDGILTGNGSIGLHNATVFEGTVSPGGIPGTLTYNGNYISSANAILSTELYGPNAGIEYDVFDIQGNAIMEGNIDLSLGFAPNVDDEFIVATTTGNITQCNLPPTVSAEFEGSRYTFDVICRNNNEVVLTVNEIALGITDNTLNNLSFYPNPTNGNFKIDLGKEYADLTLQIFNMFGQVISSQKYASAKLIDQEIIASQGIYFVKVHTKEGASKTFKVIKR